VLLVGTPAGVATIDTATGTVGAPVPSATTSPDGRLLVRADLIGTRTQLRAVDLGHDTDRWQATIEGTFEPRTVAADGSRVALTPPPGAVTPGAVAPGRTDTDLAVVHEDGATEVYAIDGNVEPEAFSLDGTALFVVQFRPAELPTTYQVRRLDLATGELGDVAGPDDVPAHSMAGIARTQVWDPDGSRLYTLYTQDTSMGVVSFVHVLDLDEQWAHCIGLPDGFTPTGGIALADGAKDLYVADVVGGVVAAVDTEALEVVADATLPSTPSAYASPIAVDDDEVYVGAGTDLLRLDRTSLEPVGSLGALRPTSEIIGIQRGTEPGELFVASPGAVLLVDLATGDVLQQTLADQAVGSFVSVGAHSIPSYVGAQCAC
jgi:hypothetical protein